MSASTVFALLALLSCSVGLAIAQFSSGFPFNMVPGGLRIPFIGGSNGGVTGLGGYGNTLGSGLSTGLGGQQGGWGAQPVAPMQQVVAAPVQSGWGAQPVVQQLVRPVIQQLAAPVQSGWGTQPVVQQFTAPVQSGWGSQPVVTQPVVQQLAAPITTQQSGWGAQPVAAPVIIPQAAPVTAVVAPTFTAPVTTNSGWGAKSGFGAV